jgi:MFS family permease
VLQYLAFAYIVPLPLVIFAPTIWLAALAMALFGAVMGSMDVAMNANAVEVERRLGYAIMSASHGFWSLGGFVGGVCGSYVVATWGPEVQALCVAAVTAAVVMAASPKLLAEAPHKPKPDDARQPIFTRDLTLWTLGLLALFSMIPEGAIMDWAAIYLNKELGADLFQSGLGFAFFAGVMAIMRFVGDRIRNRFGAVRTIRYSGLISALGLLIAATSPTYVFAIIGFSISGIGVANMIPILFSAAGNQSGHNPGVAISTVTMVGYAGILFAPSIIGVIAEHIGFRVTYAALSLLLLFVAWQADRAAAADGVRAGT